MKKLQMLALTFMVIFVLVACDRNNPSPSADSAMSAEISTPELSDSPSGETETDTNILIAYFSMPVIPDDVDAVSAASRLFINDDEFLGNTQFVAQNIAQATGGELFSIETVQEYPETREQLLEFANEERAQNARPELAAHIDNLDDYDIIFIGFPTWWGDMPMVLYTFLEEHDFSGKTIVPFGTNGGGGFPRTIDAIADLHPDATVIENVLSMSRNTLTSAENDVNAWVEELDLWG